MSEITYYSLIHSRILFNKVCIVKQFVHHFIHKNIAKMIRKTTALLSNGWMWVHLQNKTKLMKYNWSKQLYTPQKYTVCIMKFSSDFFLQDTGMYSKIWMFWLHKTWYNFTLDKSAKYNLNFFISKENNFHFYTLT